MNKNEKMPEVDFHEVVENLADGVLVTDGEGRTLYVNPAFCRYTDIAPEDIIGRSVYDVEREGKIFRHSISGDVIRTKRRMTGAGLIRMVDGRSHNGYATGVPVFDGEGGLRMVVSSHVDEEMLRARFDEFKKTIRADDAIQIFEKYTGASDPLLGEDKTLRKLQRIVAMAAPTDVSVLIMGESGSGKEVFADMVQRLSSRRDGPYVKINCMAVPANLLESELFGRERDNKAGLFEIADTGTILLDEIGDLPADLQTKLLHVLEQSTVARLGGGEERAVDVRVIAATNADLRQKIQEGSFREDLYYRLSAIPFMVPPLRERRDDIPELTRFYLSQYCRKYGRELRLPEGAMDTLQSFDWPGNVRELKNVLEYLVICSEGDELDMQKFNEIMDVPTPAEPPVMDFKEATERYKKQLIEAALIRAGGVRRAAALLNIDPSTVSRQAKRYGIPIPGMGEDADR